MRRLSWFLAVIGVGVLPTVLAADTIVEEIIARVNNEIITRSEFLRSKEQLKQEAQQQDPSRAEALYAEREKDILRDLIDQQLLLEKAKDMGITADTEVIKRLDEMRKQMGLDTMEDLEKAAQAQGVSFEDFKQNLRNQIITQQVIGKEVGKAVRKVLEKNGTPAGAGEKAQVEVVPEPEPFRVLLRGIHLLRSGEVLGDDVVILDGVSPGEQVAATGCHALDHREQALREIGAGEILRELGAVALGNAGDQRLLGGEVAVQVAGTHAGLGADLLHRGPVKSGTHEAALRRFEDLVPAVGLPLELRLAHGNAALHNL